MHRSQLHVVGGIDNPQRYKAPIRLCREWLQFVLDSGASVTLVERQQGERPFEFSPDEPLCQHVNLVQFRSGPEHEVWLQHALYNKGISTLPDDVGYVCWQDTDVKHMRPDWVDETLHALQHYRVVQTWTHAIDLDPQGNIAPNDWDNEVDRSFAAAWIAGEVDIEAGPYAPCAARALLEDKPRRDWRSHTGYSWAMRRDTLRKIGRLLDWMIIGSGDYHMAHAFVGNLRQMVANWKAQPAEHQYAPGYYRRLLEFADLCERYVQQDLGCVPGTLAHGWHGSKFLRLYGSREDVIRESKFDPDRDITFDVHGMPTLCSDNRLLRDGLRRYNRRRNADSIDIYPPRKKA